MDTSGHHLPEHRFLLDEMLGTLARWLRICGYDAEYTKNLSDEDLIREAAEERRILLTRDKLLHRKAMKGGVESFIVEGENDAVQLASLSKEFGLQLFPEGSRCPRCGAFLTHADKEEVRGRVHGRTLEAYDEFWMCPSCGQIYWRGSHWRSIEERIEEASRLASSP